jgi:integration host factor subunit alpha
VQAPKTTTKAVLAHRVHATVDELTKIKSAALVDLLFEFMKETFARGEMIKVRRFGNFTLIDKRARPGRNPQSGEPTEIAERRVVTFKTSRHLRLALNPPVQPAPPETLS